MQALRRLPALQSCSLQQHRGAATAATLTRTSRASRACLLPTRAGKSAGACAWLHAHARTHAQALACTLAHARIPAMAHAQQQLCSHVPARCVRLPAPEVYAAELAAAEASGEWLRAFEIVAEVSGGGPAPCSRQLPHVRALACWATCARLKPAHTQVGVLELSLESSATESAIRTLARGGQQCVGGGLGTQCDTQCAEYVQCGARNSPPHPSPAGGQWQKSAKMLNELMSRHSPGGDTLLAVLKALAQHKEVEQAQALLQVRVCVWCVCMVRVCVFVRVYACVCMVRLCVCAGLKKLQEQPK